MKSLRFVGMGVLVLASAVMCYGQRGRGAAGGGHISGPPSVIGNGAAHSGMETSNHGSPAGNQTQSQKRSTEQLLDQNSKLSANLQKILPQGTTPQQACSGFSNLGRCVAAIHVSHNLGIPFSDLKDKLTGANAENLGKAIHDLKPDVDSKAEKKKAEKQAKADADESAS
jgi:hypothetical protein